MSMQAGLAKRPAADSMYMSEENIPRITLEKLRHAVLQSLNWLESTNAINQEFVDGIHDALNQIENDQYF